MKRYSVEMSGRFKYQTEVLAESAEEARDFVFQGLPAGLDLEIEDREIFELPDEEGEG